MLIMAMGLKPRLWTMKAWRIVQHINGEFIRAQAGMKKRRAPKRIVNVPLPAGSGDKTYERIADEIFVPFIQSFKPELILVSAGFDAHWNDPITTLGLSSAGFYMLSKKLVDLAEEHCGGKIVFVLEGGYNATNLANGADAVFAALMNKGFVDLGDVSPRKETDASGMIENVCERHQFIV